MHLNSLDLAMRANTCWNQGLEKYLPSYLCCVKYYLITSDKFNNFLRKAPSIYLYYAVASNEQREPLHLIGS